MKGLFFTFLACLLVGCASDKKEQIKTEAPKKEITLPETKKDSTPENKPTLSKEDSTPEKKPALSKEDSIRLHTKLSPKFIPEDRDIIKLLQESDSVIIISHIGSSWVWRTTKDSLKAVKEAVKLTPEQRILFIKTLNKNANAIIKKVGLTCWNPHHKVYFYTNQRVSWWWICFDCGSKQSAGISFLNAPNIDLQEKGTIAQLFKKFGLTYQL